MLYYSIIQCSIIYYHIISYNMLYNIADVVLGRYFIYYIVKHIV